MDISPLRPLEQYRKVLRPDFCSCLIYPVKLHNKLSWINFQRQVIVKSKDDTLLRKILYRCQLIAMVPKFSDNLRLEGLAIDSSVRGYSSSRFF